jgi:outer membrane biosynthesis protein TonB
LTERPKVVEDATSDMRLILPGIESQSVVLRLLINEAGAIDQVEVENSNLTPEVEPIVVGAFNRLRFTPGKIDGVAVKCQLKIEVMLENADTVPLKR